MSAFVAIFFGAGIGGMLRHGVNLAAARLFGMYFPYGTLVVNVVGSLLMGLLAGYFAFKGEAPQVLRLFFMAGILSGFTTFSTFSLDAVLLLERGQIVAAAVYVGGSFLLAVVGVAVGLTITRMVFD